MKFNFIKSEEEIKKMRINLIKTLPCTHGYSLLRSSISLKNDDAFMLEFAKKYDKYGYMSQQMGMELDNLFKDKECVIGIYRTGDNYISASKINLAFNKGFIISENLLQNNSNYQVIQKIFSIYNDFAILISQLKTAHEYKNSEGCIIIKIPKSYFENNEVKTSSIFYLDGEHTRLSPKFIYGYIPLLGNGILGNIIHNPNYEYSNTQDDLLDNEDIVCK